MTGISIQRGCELDDPYNVNEIFEPVMIERFSSKCLSSILAQTTGMTKLGSHPDVDSKVQNDHDLHI